MVKVPPIVMATDPPAKVPPAKEAAPDTAMVFAPWLMVPPYPALTVIPDTLTGALMVQLPLSRPRRPPSKMATSPGPGTPAPPKPPEVADQFPALFQLPGKIATTQ